MLQNNIAQEKFTLTNTSAFPLRFTIVQKTLAYSNYTPMEVFACQPSEAVIPAGESQDVVVTFSPDHSRPDAFVASYLVDIPNQETERIITVRGRCWDRQLYVLPSSTGDEIPSDDPERLGDSLAMPVAMTPVVEALTAEDVGIEADINETAPYSVRLQYAKPETGGYETDATLVKELTVGSCVPNDTKLGSGGSFEVEWNSEDPAVSSGIFSVDNAKGNLNAGASSTLKFTFKPPAVEDRAAGSGNSVGQWVQTIATVVLKGGFCSEGVPETQRVNVLLRGFVPL